MSVISQLLQSLSLKLTDIRAIILSGDAFNVGQGHPMTEETVTKKIEYIKIGNKCII